MKKVIKKIDELLTQYRRYINRNENLLMCSELASIEDFIDNLEEIKEQLKGMKR